MVGVNKVHILKRVNTVLFLYNTYKIGQEGLMEAKFDL